MIRWFRNLEIRNKLILGFGLLTVIILVVGLMGYSYLKQINYYLQDATTKELPSLNFLVQADRDLQQLLVAERSMMFAEVNSDNFNRFLADYEENLQQSAERWESYKALATMESEKSLIKKYETARKKWTEVSQNLLTNIKVGDDASRQRAINLSLNEVQVEFESMRDQLDKLQEIPGYHLRYGAFWYYH
jgi:methyl-accepting chemotaxis protein